MNRSCASLSLLAWMLVCLVDALCRADHPTQANVPLLPTAVDSFGAAVHDGWLYVYGGHQGNREDQTPANLARLFVRCHPQKNQQWDELPADGQLQNLALVSCGKFLYRIGGLASDESAAGEFLQSVSDCACFDPDGLQWTQLPALPAPRSAHDAIAVDGKIYVIGGLQEKGGKAIDWHDSALVFDTTTGADARWESLPTPSFRLRNLAVAAWQNCIWAIGGQDDEGVASQTVYCFDPQRGYWSEGPELPMRTEGLQGFGAAAWGLDSGLYVSGADGVLYRLMNVYGKWERVAQLRVPRFCHRLLPDGETALLAVAGYSIAFGQTASVERIKVYSP